MGAGSWEASSWNRGPGMPRLYVQSNGVPVITICVCVGAWSLVLVG